MIYSFQEFFLLKTSLSSMAPGSGIQRGVRESVSAPTANECDVRYSSMSGIQREESQMFHPQWGAGTVSPRLIAVAVL